MIFTHSPCSVFFFFNDPATPEIYTLSLHDALPIWPPADPRRRRGGGPGGGVAAGYKDAGKLKAGAESDRREPDGRPAHGDRKSTRLNSSHSSISYAVFCLKKKKKKHKNTEQRKRRV